MNNITLDDIEKWEIELEPKFNEDLKQCKSYPEVYALMETINPKHEASHCYMDWVIENWIDNIRSLGIEIHEGTKRFWEYKNIEFKNNNHGKNS